MSSQDLHALSAALGLEPDRLAAAVEVVRAAVREEISAAAAPAWLSVDEVARRTGLSAETVQDHARRGRIPMFKFAGTWRMTPSAFEAWERRVSAEGLPVEARQPRRRAA